MFCSPHPPTRALAKQNLDKLIHYANLDGRLNVFYSSPEAYIAAKHSYHVPWPLKTDDMFPYADSAHSYWTGYFTTRPASKGFIRAATAYLQAARHAEVLVGGVGWVDRLEAAVSLTQHHDAITGTEKQHVANDYHRSVVMCANCGNDRRGLCAGGCMRV